MYKWHDCGKKYVTFMLHKMKRKGEKGRPTAQDFKDAAKTAKKMYPNQN